MRAPLSSPAQRQLACVLLAALAAGLSFPAAADTEDGWFSYSIPVELQNDWNYRSDSPDNRLNDLFLKIEPEATIRVPSLPGLSFFAHGVFEPVRDPAPGRNRAFKDKGFFIEDLYARYETGPVAFRAGKMNPGFGIAWDRAPGIYGDDFTEDYELTERIALSATVTMDAGELGRHAVTGGAFFLDTSPLRHTLIGRSRGTLSRADGGVSNTGEFSSFNLVLDGELSGPAGLYYHLGYVRQAHGVDGTSAETGVAAALGAEIPLGGEIGLNPLFEAVRLRNLGGDPDTDRIYLSPSVQVTWRSWNTYLAYTRRTTRQQGTPQVADSLFHAGIGYEFAIGLTADIAWKRQREDRETTDTIGLLFTYAFGS